MTAYVTLENLEEGRISIDYDGWGDTTFTIEEAEEIAKAAMIYRMAYTLYDGYKVNDAEALEYAESAAAEVEQYGITEAQALRDVIDCYDLEEA